jgi:hypothetical protein
LLFFDVFVFVYGAEFHAACFAGAGGADAHALREEGVAFPAVGAAGDYAGCCVEGVVYLGGCGVFFGGGWEGLSALGGFLEGWEGCC